MNSIPSLNRSEKDMDERTKNPAMTASAPINMRCKRLNMRNLYRCLRCSSSLMVALSACMIQSRKPLSVNASGITKLSNIIAEVDSMSRYTRPMA